MTGDELADRYLVWYAERCKASSLDTTTRTLKAFRAHFGARRSTRSTRSRPRTGRAPSRAQPCRASSRCSATPRPKRLVDAYNPFDGARRQPWPWPRRSRPADRQGARGAARRLRRARRLRADQMRRPRSSSPLTRACRPGELYELRWSDIDLAAQPHPPVSAPAVPRQGRHAEEREGEDDRAAAAGSARRSCASRRGPGARSSSSSSKMGCQLTAPHDSASTWKLV